MLTKIKVLNPPLIVHVIEHHSIQYYLSNRNILVIRRVVHDDNDVM